MPAMTRGEGEGIESGDGAGTVDAAEPAPEPPTADEPFGFRDLAGPIFVILVMAAVLRCFSLGTNPPEYFEDELSGAVSAWSIVTTGHDVGHTVLPFPVTRLEVKQPLYFYATVPFQAVLGHGALAGRLPAALFGVLTTALLIWLGSRLTGNVFVGLVTGGLFAVSPWAVHYGRVGWEPAAVLPFTVGGVGLLWLGLQAHRRAWVIASAALLAVGAYTYHPALLMNALFAAVVMLLCFRSLRRADLVALAVGAGVAALILVPYALAIRDPLFLERTRNISVFKDGITPDALAHAWGNYWTAWNPHFLLVGGGPTPRVNPGQLVLASTLPALLVGLDTAVHRRGPADRLLLAWMVLGPLSAAITTDVTVPSAARALFVLPALMILAAIGTVRIVAWIGGRATPQRRELALRAAALTVAAIVLVETWSWTTPYFASYPTASQGSWSYGTAGAFAMARRTVPAGATLCVAEPDVSSYTYPQQVALYLPDPGFTVIEGADDARCRLPGAYILMRPDRKLDVPVVEIATQPGLGTPDPVFRLVRVATS